MTPDDVEPQDASESTHPDDAGLEDAGLEEVRRLLAAAADDPAARMPQDVAHRLDGVLAGLVAERGGQGDLANTSTVVRLPERPLRRWPTVLVAAATVAVLGLGIGTALNRTDSGESSDSAAAGQAEDRSMLQSPSTDPRVKDKPDSLQQGRHPAPLEDSESDSLARKQRALPNLRSASLRADAQRIANLSSGALDLSKRPAPPAECVAPAIEQGDQLFSVRLDGKPATLALRSPQNGHRLAQVYACQSTGSPVVSTSLDVSPGKP